MKNVKFLQKEKFFYKGENIFMKVQLKKSIIKISEWNKEHTFLSSVLASLVASGILGIWGYFFAIKPVQDLEKNFIFLSENNNNIFSSLQSQLTETQTQINNNEEKINNLQANLNSQISNIQNEFTEYQNIISNMINSQNIIINNEVKISPVLFDALYNTYNTDQTVFSSNKKCQFENQEATLLTNEKTGQIYTVNDLKEEKLTLHYTDNGDDIYFKGQYDENGYWDGNCIINRYDDGNLILIMDAEYDSGELISYKQVFSYKKTFLGSSYDVWAISERKPEGKVNEGATWTYFKQNDYNQPFETDLVTESDILNIEDFKKNIPLLCEGYYSGYTSDGKYNDTTGNAYLVKYTEYGYVRYLYVGNIIDGYPHDYTGKAWSISWGYDNENYYYYKGIFKNGNHIGKTPECISVEDIKSQYVNPDNFECELKWIENNNNM